MKFKVLSALFLSVCLAAPSFGGGLLDRMLGSGCGCAVEPSCGCCENYDEPSCGANDCGCDTDPSCGCNDDCGDACNSSCDRPNLLNRLFSRIKNKDCCDTCVTEPSCGANDCGCDTAPSCGANDCGSACDSCCGRPNLLERLLGRIRDRGCGCASTCESSCEPSCGCNSAPACGCGGSTAPAEINVPSAAPAVEVTSAPTPMADPNASLGQQRDIVRTSFAR